MVLAWGWDWCVGVTSLEAGDWGGYLYTSGEKIREGGEGEETDESSNTTGEEGIFSDRNTPPAPSVVEPFADSPFLYLSIYVFEG